MPVAQVVDWLRDLLAAPMEEARVGLGGQAAQARQQRIDDARKETDVYASMAHELDNCFAVCATFLAQSGLDDSLTVSADARDFQANAAFEIL